MRREVTRPGGAARAGGSPSRAETVVWTLLMVAFVVVWVARPTAEALDLPRAVTAVDVPLIAIAALLALVTSRARHWRTGPWLWVWAAGLALVAVVSAWQHDRLARPELLGGVALLLEPFLFVAAFTQLDMDQRRRRWSVGVLLVVMTAQLPVAIAQFIEAGDSPGAGDAVQGTLVGAGAASHMVAAALVIVSLAVAMSELSRWQKAAILSVTSVVIYAADAKQVVAAAPVAILLVAAYWLTRRALRAAVLGAVAGVAVAAIAGVVLALNAGLFGQYVQYTLETRGGKIASTSALVADLQDAGPRALVGFGPGETVTRFATLSTPASREEGSTVDVFDIPASPRAQRYQALTTSEGFVGTSSFTMAMSSGIGVLGDYGFLGLAAYVALVCSVLRALWTSHNRWVTPALVGWGLALSLGLVTDGLEEPPLMLVTSFVTALALTGHRERSASATGAAE